MLDSNRSVSPARQAYSSKPAAVECGRRIEQTNTISLHTMQAVPIKRYTHTRLTALYPGLPRSAGTRKVKPMWILLKQETVSGNGISWAICKSAPSSRQITTPAPHHSVFSGRMPFLLPNQQRQSTEGTDKEITRYTDTK